MTKDDILAFVGQDARPRCRGANPDAASAPPLSAPTRASRDGRRRAGTTVPMSVMRKKIAEHMVHSKRTSAHVHSVFEVNFSRVDEAAGDRRRTSTSAPAPS